MIILKAQVVGSSGLGSGELVLGLLELEGHVNAAEDGVWV